jgi:ribosomal-protein-alanine N-acetyltransferase
VPTARAPETIATARLLLRRPRMSDAAAIFERYASDPEVTRYVGWPMHRRVEETRAFVAFSDADWARSPAGAYLILSSESGALLGSTGLAFETPFRAATGYALAKDAWGRGYATEALAAMVDTARALGVRRLYALCHHGHRASARVLEKSGFSLEGVLRQHSEFPNLLGAELCDVRCYATILEIPSSTRGEKRS